MQNLIVESLLWKPHSCFLFHADVISGEAGFGVRSLQWKHAGLITWLDTKKDYTGYIFRQQLYFITDLHGLTLTNIHEYIALTIVLRQLSHYNTDTLRFQAHCHRQWWQTRGGTLTNNSPSYKRPITAVLQPVLLYYPTKSSPTLEVCLLVGNGCRFPVALSTNIKYFFSALLDAVPGDGSALLWEKTHRQRIYPTPTENSSTKEVLPKTDLDRLTALGPDCPVADWFITGRPIHDVIISPAAVILQRSKTKRGHANMTYCGGPTAFGIHAISFVTTTWSV